MSGEANEQNLSTEGREEGTAQQPSEGLDRDREAHETIPRKSSLTGED